MGVALFCVAKGLDKLFDGHRLLVGKGVPLGLDTGCVDEDVGVGHDAGDGAGNVVVNLVHLFGRFGGLEELGGHLFLTDKHNTVGGQDADCRSGITDGLHRILHLVETALRGEDCRSAIIPTRHFQRSLQDNRRKEDQLIVT